MPFLPIWGRGRAFKNNIVGAIGWIFLSQASSKTLAFFSPFGGFETWMDYKCKTLKSQFLNYVGIAFTSLSHS